MSRFFHNQIEEGWLEEDATLNTARHWLQDTAEQFYCPKYTRRSADIDLPST